MYNFDASLMKAPFSFCFCWGMWALLFSFWRMDIKKSQATPNVIKLSKSAHTKKCPPRKIEVGIFYAFVMWFACAYLAGRTMTCPS